MIYKSIRWFSATAESLIFTTVMFQCARLDYAVSVYQWNINAELQEISVIFYVWQEFCSLSLLEYWLVSSLGFWCCWLYLRTCVS